MNNLTQAGRRVSPSQSYPKHSPFRIGTKIGEWTIIETGLVKKFKTQAHHAYRVRCGCGFESLKTTGELRAGKSSSCGCKRFVRAVGYQRPDFKLIPIGTMFGIMTVTENDLVIYRTSRKANACKLRCKCGNEIVRCYGSLRRDNKHKSCGCQRYKTRKEQHSLVPVGTQFDYWTVIENGLYRTCGKTTARACRVKCRCGSEAVYWAGSLVSGKTKSCGCARNGHSIERLWRSLYREFSRRGRDFHLTLPEFKFLAQQPCAYCGLEPSTVHKYRLDPIDTSMKVLWSGLDRIDSSKDYVHGNVVPCCTRCNIMKMDSSVDDFFAQIERIYAYNSSTEKIHQIAAVISPVSC